MSSDDRNDLTTLELTWEMPIGRQGLDDSSDTPLRRALDSLLGEGRPAKRFVQCWINSPDQTLRWLGVFVHTAGDRVCFFPGFATPFDRVVSYEMDAPRWDQPFELDHLTIERDRRSWHLTSPGSADHLGALPTKALGSGCVHWFGMSIATPQCLREAYQQTIARWNVPTRDIDRRGALLGPARENVVHSVVSLNTQEPLPPQPAFIHVNVLLGRPGFVVPDAGGFAIPAQGRFIVADPDHPEQFAIRVHRAGLSDAVELELRVAMLRGSVRNTPIAFSGAR